MPHPSLPESTLGPPDDANDTEGAHSIAHSIRQEGAALRSVVSSTARTTVHGAGGSEVRSEVPMPTLGTPADASGTEGGHTEVRHNAPARTPRRWGSVGCGRGEL